MLCGSVLLRTARRVRREGRRVGVAHVEGEYVVGNLREQVIWLLVRVLERTPRVEWRRLTGIRRL